MGLDMYAYVAAKQNQSDEFWADATMDPATKEYVNPNVLQPRELAYWRKHPNLHGWMERLYRSKGGTGDFNGDELELCRDDIDMLEEDILAGRLPATSGFFFGRDADEYYKQHDLEFVKNARAELFCGLRVFYNSSW